MVICGKIINQNQELRININQIFSGVSKDFIFELTVPKSEIKDLQDFERNLEIINVQLTARPVDSMLQTLKESKLVLTLFTDNEQVAQDSEINDNVEFNYIRVKAAQAIEEAIKYADQNQYNQGQHVLSDMLKQIEKSHPKNQAKLQVLKDDLVQCQQNVQPQVYQIQGKLQAQQQCVSHYNQQSQAVRLNDMYQIPLQKQMVQQQQQQKQQQIWNKPQQLPQQLIQLQKNPQQQIQQIIHDQFLQILSSIQKYIKYDTFHFNI
ncbi:von willebrand factor type A domain protein (macronuclear) [Tetrahymena thermophila SB210]|uniref:von willebrand factor type A domain protein n=1 Tax=Tetrahymena thermophila (strain SB210) TaxID=312017 RepID=Q22N43_TETTS|nr:von willebrand factor type A domain protein [Tetrahymena thermophila SB210]EAR86689.3 von willebrand factor type A domain protein [Tetrahymena thermophila SB210]|eukprot:XP_977284.3 von willebrand factor type A domain protein [Tetrahymena thermophila SB210]